MEMTSEETVFVRNVLSYRLVVYAFAVSATFSILILSLGIILGENMLIAGVGVLIASTPALMMVVVALKLPIGFEVNAEGIHVFFRKQRKQLILWKDVVSLKLVNKDLDRYLLRFLKDDGHMAFWGLSVEPAEKVRELWNKLFPRGRGIGDDSQFRFPAGLER